MKAGTPGYHSDDEKKVHSASWMRNPRPILASVLTALVLLLLNSGADVRINRSQQRRARIYDAEAVDIDGTKFMMGDRFAGKFMYIVNVASR